MNDNPRQTLVDALKNQVQAGGITMEEALVLAYDEGLRHDTACSVRRNEQADSLIRIVEDVLCTYIACTPAVLYSSGRQAYKAEARRWVWYFIRACGQGSVPYTTLGERYHRNHSTVIAGVKSVAFDIKNYGWAKERHADIKNLLRERGLNPQPVTFKDGWKTYFI